MTDSLDCSLDLLRRLPPSKIKQNLAKVIQLKPDLAEELLAAVDQPLQVLSCKKTGKEFLICDYNRDGTFYRSPWSGEYQSLKGTDKPPAGGYKPSVQLAQLESAFNEGFDTYRELYFGGGISSVYLWDLDQGFAGSILIKKVTLADGTNGGGTWDSTHVVQVNPITKKTASYKLTSTIMLQIIAPKASSGPEIDLSGSLTRQTEQDGPTDSVHSHLYNIGRMIEEMENKMRATMQEIYFGKTKDILNELRSLTDLGTVKSQAAIQAQLIGRLNERVKP